MSRKTTSGEAVLVLVWHNDTEHRLGILPNDRADFIEDVLLEAGIPVDRKDGDDCLWTHNRMSTATQTALRHAGQEVVYLDKTVHPYSVAIKDTRSGAICMHLMVDAHTRAEARRMAMLAFHHRRTRNNHANQEASSFALSDYTVGDVVKTDGSIRPLSPAR